MTVAQSAVDQRFEQYAQEVYGWAYRLLGRHHDALDVVQDVFLRWNRQCQRRVPSSPRAWVRRVAVNRAVDIVRSRRHQGHALGRLANPTDARSIERAMDEETLRLDVATALNRLTDLQRAVLIAKVYDDLTFAEIATEHDVSLSTVKTHYLRAVRTVRDGLRRWDDREPADKLNRGQ